MYLTRPGLEPMIYCTLTIIHHQCSSLLNYQNYLIFLAFQGNILQQILSVEFMLELVNTVPFLVTVSVVVFDKNIL